MTPSDHKKIDLVAARQMVGLFALSAAVLFYELLLMRIFSVLMWYHFASLAIGLAMLGLGAGGLAVGLRPGLGKANRAAPWALLFSVGVASVLLFMAATHAYPQLARAVLAPFHQPFYKPFSRPDSTKLGWEMTSRLALLAVGTGWPFLFAGAATAGILTKRAPRLHGAYAATFLGSAVGCVIFLGALAVVSAPAALGFAAALAAAAALLFSPGKKLKLLALALTLATVALGVWAQRSGSAEIPFARGRFEPGLLAVRWNTMSRVAAYPLPAGDTRKPYGQSRTYRGAVPKQIGLVVDDSGYTNLFEGTTALENPEYFRSNLVALPHHLRPGGRALLFGPGGGKDIWIALAFPGATVTAVEINPQVVEMVQETFVAFTKGPYSQPGVTLVENDARRFAAVDTASYDVIEASAVFGRMPPAAGAFTLSEDLLHTVEGFQDYWNRLDERGILSITRFAYEQRALRLVALARALLEREGVKEPGRHIRVLSDRGLANVLVGKTPFDARPTENGENGENGENDDERLQELSKRYGFGFLYPSPDGTVNQLTRLVDDEDFESALAAVPFDVSPPTDDRPFFYYTVRPEDFIRGSLPGRAGFDDRGAEVLRAAFAILASLACLALLLPVLLVKGLPRVRRGVGGAAIPLLYFAAIGLGYMVLEIGIMKRLFLLLGHPVYAVSATLFAFLVGSGLGSLCTEKLAPTGRALAGWLALTALFGALHAHLGPQLAEHFLASSTVVRFGAAGFAVFLPAFVMGLAFPGAIRLLGAGGAAMVPWAWAVNGAASVTASLGAVLIAMNWGYTATLTTGACLYLFAALIAPLMGRGDKSV